MSDRYEFDTDELVEQLGEHQRLTGTESQGRGQRDDSHATSFYGRCQRRRGVGRRSARRTRHPRHR